MSNVPGNLSAWLSNTKAKFLEDLKKDGAKSWTVAMGNEAGDLDSCASAIAYAYLSPKKPVIGLIRTPRPDLYLRPENLLAFKLTGLPKDYHDLLTIDDFSSPLDELSSSFALVDHNSLSPQFLRPADSPQGPSIVSGIIDHHDDEHQHLDVNPRRIVVPLGSCASLVTETFKDSFKPENPAENPPPPAELATLLLTAIYIDTNGLKEGGKAEQIDYAAASFLETLDLKGAGLGGHEDSVFRKETTQALKKHKQDVSHLSSRDLLRRDYKQYVYTSVDGTSITVGLSTVPLGMKAWLEKDPDNFRVVIEAWASERGLDVVGVLNTFKSHKGHKRRELFILVGGATKDAPPRKLNLDILTTTLVQGLEADQELLLEPVEIKDAYKDIKGPLGEHADGGERHGQVKLWKQLNTDATRKTIGPKLKEIIQNGKDFAGLQAAVPENK